MDRRNFVDFDSFRHIAETHISFDDEEKEASKNMT